MYLLLCCIWFCLRTRCWNGSQLSVQQKNIEKQNPKKRKRKKHEKIENYEIFSNWQDFLMEFLRKWNELIFPVEFSILKENSYQKECGVFKINGIYNNILNKYSNFFVEKCFRSFFFSFFRSFFEIFLIFWIWKRRNFMEQKGFWLSETNMNSKIIHFNLNKWQYK